MMFNIMQLIVVADKIIFIALDRSHIAHRTFMHIVHMLSGYGLHLSKVIREELYPNKEAASWIIRRGALWPTISFLIWGIDPMISPII